jgi:V/A-type H+-transporting ATPase subunit I
MERRLVDIPVEIDTLHDRINAAIQPHEAWAAARIQARERLDQLIAMGHLGATAHTFVIAGWVPVTKLEDVRREIAAIGEGEVVLELAPIDDSDEPPVLMENRRPARPFEALVSLLSAPRYGSLDPTTLMMIFLPLFFGMMLGDIVYGGLVMAGALYLRHRFRVSSPSVSEFGRIFVLAAGWAIVWGIVYGELLGDLGHRWFGLEPLWINREDALEPLLIFAVAVGVAHISLGLLLGVWSAMRRHDRKGLSNSIGTLLALVGLLLIVGAAMGRVPTGFMTPAVATVVVGLVLMIALEGPMGLLTGPLELMGTIGNVLSYLRIAAIGIASVYLARVANELGALGPVWIGVIVAALFHALNLALGTFSPAIQALRLHYVEFFGKFYEGGGTAFQPFGSLERKG